MRFTPEPINIRSALDEHGSFLNVDRIPGENLVSYKNRLMEVYVNRASSTYRGLINGITRELGLQQKRAFRVHLKALYSNTYPNVSITFSKLTITDTTQVWVDDELVGFGVRIGDQTFRIIQNDVDTLKIASGDLRKFIDQTGIYEIVAYNPLVLVDSTNLYLYRDYFSDENNKLDKIIGLRDINTFFTNVTTEIDSSTYFYTSSLATDSDKLFAWTLQRQGSIKVIPNELIPAAKNFELDNTGLIEGSVRFSEKSVFTNEVEEDLVSTAPGNYYIDYGKGFLLTNIFPSGNGTVSYSYSNFPFEVFYSPAVINNFKDDASRDFMFNQREMRLYNNIQEKFVAGLPKPETIEDIFELLNVTPLAWGE